MASSKELFNKYLSQIQAGQAQAQPNNALDTLLRQRADPTSAVNTMPALAPLDNAGNNDDNGFGGWLLDMLSRPLYAVGGGIRGAIDSSTSIDRAIESGNIEDYERSGLGDTLGNIASGIGHGFMGDTKETPGKILQEEAGWNVAGGIAIDLLLDPLNAIPITPIVKGVKAATAGIRGANAQTKLASELARETAIPLSTGRELKGTRPTVAVPAAADGTPKVTVAEDLIAKLATPGHAEWMKARDAATKESNRLLKEAKAVGASQKEAKALADKHVADWEATNPHPSTLPNGAGQQALPTATTNIVPDLVAQAPTTPVAARAGEEIAANAADTAFVEAAGIPATGTYSRQKILDTIDLTDRAALEPTGVSAIASAIPEVGLVAGAESAAQTLSLKSATGAPISQGAAINLITFAMKRAGVAATPPELSTLAKSLYENRQLLHDARVGGEAEAKILGPNPTPKEMPIERPTVTPEEAESLSPLLKDDKFVATDEHFTGATQAQRFQQAKATALKEIKVNSLDRSNLVAWNTTAGAMVRERVLPQLRVAEAVSERAGKMHTIKANPTATPHHVSLSDIIEAMPEDLTNRLVFGPQNQVALQKLAAGAARAIDTLATKTSKGTAVAAITASMKGTQQYMPNVKQLAEALYAARNSLASMEVQNIKRWQAKHAGDSIKVSSRIREQLDKINDETIAPGDAVDTLVNLPERVDIEVAQVGAGPGTAVAAVAQAAQDASKLVDPTTTQALRVSERTAAHRAVQPSTAKIDSADIRAEVAVDKEFSKEIETLAPEMPLDERLSLELAAGTERRVRVWRPRTPTVKAVIDLWRSVGPFGLASLEMRRFRSALDVVGKLAPDDQKTLFSLMRSGAERTAIPESQLAAFDAYTTAYNSIFDLGKHSDGMLGGLIRNGATFEQINEVMLMKFKKGELNKNIPEFKNDKNKTVADILKQAHTWQVDDPLDYLDRMYAATRQLAAHQQVAISLQNHFAKATKVGPDYFQLKDMKGLDHKLRGPVAAHLDPDLWYPKEAVEGIRWLERLVERPRSFAGSDNFAAQIVDRVYDPMLTVWKTYMTVVRPGHHIRNFMGDGFLNYMAGMRNLPKYYGDALRILVKKDSSGLTRKLTVGGTDHTLSGDEILRQFEIHGLRPSFHVQEDLIRTETPNRVYNALMENRYVKTAGKVSEKTGEEGKMAQFLWELGREGNIRAAKNIDHLYAIAARNVRKWHPDASGLFGNEARIMRRIVPFYTWIRQAFPLVAETTLYRPGRVLALPIVNYNIAIANGANPSSLSNQFNDNLPYPSFVMNNVLGPYNKAGDALNLGSPVEGTYGEFLNAPWEGISGSATPFVKTPLELMFGDKATGQRITDRSEWVDNAIPVVNSLSSISGYSAVGTVGNLLSTKPGPILDPQRSVLRNEKDHWMNTSLANWLTGLGMQNYQKPSYMRIGLNESRSVGGS